MGYKISGIDLTDKIESEELRRFMEVNGWQVEMMRKVNFLEFDTLKRYDIVASFGFIEHFDNWQEILKRHTKYLKDDGILIIEVPNFVGLIQRVYHILFDYENYKRHVISSMEPQKWVKVLGDDYDIIYSGYFGEFVVWDNKPKPTIIQKCIRKGLNIVGRLLKRKLPCSRLYSPLCGMIARKKS
jgi:SAM-dependent methyltransferase